MSSDLTPITSSDIDKYFRCNNIAVEVKEIDIIIDEDNTYEYQKWSDWMMETDRPNLLFYGLGSKQKLLEEFKEILK